MTCLQWELNSRPPVPCKDVSRLRYGLTLMVYSVLIVTPPFLFKVKWLLNFQVYPSFFLFYIFTIASFFFTIEDLSFFFICSIVKAKERMYVLLVRAEARTSQFAQGCFTFTLRPHTASYPHYSLWSEKNVFFSNDNFSAHKTILVYSLVLFLPLIKT